MKIRIDKFFSLITPLILTFFILFYLKINWGWIDDVFYNNNFHGLTTDLPVYDQDYFIGISKALIFLYNTFPNTGWLGIFLLVLMVIAFLMANILIVDSLKIETSSIFYQSMYSVIMAIVFSTFIFRLNFTVTCIFSVSIGLLTLEKYFNNKFYCSTAFLLILLGFLIRWQIGLLFIIQYLIYFFLKRYKINGFESVLKSNVKILSCIFILTVVIYYFSFNKDVINFYKTTTYEWIIQDAYLLSLDEFELNNFSEKDKLKLTAVKAWNTQDGDIINTSFYKELFNSYKVNIKSIINLFILKFKLAVNSSSKYKGDASPFNWHHKLIIALFILMLSSSIFFNSKRQGVLLLSSLTFLFIIMVLVKSEDRFIFPFLSVLFLQLIIMTNEKKIMPIIWHKLFMLLIFFSSLLLLLNNYNQSKIILKDLKNKKTFIDEMNQEFNQKILLFDAFTPYMLQVSPFKTVSLNSTNSYSLALHYGRNNFASINSFFSKKQNSHMSYIDVFNEIDKVKNQVVFVYTDFSIMFLKEWNTEFYKRDDNFKPILKNPKLSNINNMYLWNKMKMNYYKLI